MHTSLSQLTNTQLLYSAQTRFDDQLVSELSIRLDNVLEETVTLHNQVAALLTHIERLNRNSRLLESQMNDVRITTND
jgi:hypothetical protein